VSFLSKDVAATDAAPFVSKATVIEGDLDDAADSFTAVFDDVQALDKGDKLGTAITKAKACKFLSGSSS